jgi:hypothetical protein
LWLTGAQTLDIRGCFQTGVNIVVILVWSYPEFCAGVNFGETLSADFLN